MARLLPRRLTVAQGCGLRGGWRANGRRCGGIDGNQAGETGKLTWNLGNSEARGDVRDRLLDGLSGYLPLVSWGQGWRPGNLNSRAYCSANSGYLRVNRQMENPKLESGWTVFRAGNWVPRWGGFLPRPRIALKWPLKLEVARLRADGASGVRCCAESGSDAYNVGINYGAHQRGERREVRGSVEWILNGPLVMGSPYSNCIKECPLK